MKPRRSSSLVMGMARTALVLEIGAEKKAIISSVNAQITGRKGENRVTFIGPAEIADKTRANVRAIVINLVDHLTQSLGIAKQNYEISVSNIGATSSEDIGLKVSGYSADLPIFLAMASASLQLPLPQDVVTTGHLASASGDIAPVSGILEKMKGSIADPSVTTLIYPDLSKDRSMKILIPGELKKVREKLDECRGSIDQCPVQDIARVFEEMLNDEDIALASLKAGFYGITDTFNELDDPVSRTASYILRNNEGRFWKALEIFLLGGEFEKAKGLLREFALYHIKRKRYPGGFGGKLSELMVSLPPIIKKKRLLFPLIHMKDCTRLTQFSDETDYPDVRLLFNASCGDLNKGKAAQEDHKKKDTAVPDSGDGSLLGYFLEELSPQNIAREVLLPIDHARAAYNVDKVTVENYEEFNEAVESFYCHLLRYLNQIGRNVDRRQLAPNAHDLLSRTFRIKGGDKAAYMEGINGINGGLRYIFDQMTETLKREEKEKYIRAIFIGVIDPLDFEKKTELMKTFMNRLGNDLPEEIREIPPSQLAGAYEEIIRAYSESLDKVIDMLKII